MPEFLRGELQAAPEPLVVLGRLVISMLLGGVVAWIYKHTRPESDTASSLAVTLVLLSVLTRPPLRLALDRVSHWAGVGAQLSPTVARLVDQAKKAA